MTVLVLSGGGRYADPWHDFAATSAQVAGIVSATGRGVAVDDAVDARLADLADTGLADTDLADVELLIMNVGDPNHRGDHDGTPASAVAGLARYVAAGGSLLCLHTSITAFTDVPAWEPLVGGRWVRGTSFHPPIGAADVRVVADHPVVAGLDDFTLRDERYTDLRVDPAVTVLAEHTHDARPHPLVWVSPAGPNRVVTDLLGHDAGSYADPHHARLLQQAVGWLLAAP